MSPGYSFPWNGLLRTSHPTLTPIQNHLLTTGVTVEGTLGGMVSRAWIIKQHNCHLTYLQGRLLHVRCPLRYRSEIQRHSFQTRISDARGRYDFP